MVGGTVGGTVCQTVDATVRGTRIHRLRRTGTGRPHPQRHEVPGAPERQPSHRRAPQPRSPAADLSDLRIQTVGGTVLRTVGETVTGRVWRGVWQSSISTSNSISNSRRKPLLRRLRRRRGIGPRSGRGQERAGAPRRATAVRPPGRSHPGQHRRAPVYRQGAQGLADRHPADAHQGRPGQEGLHARAGRVSRPLVPVGRVLAPDHPQHAQAAREAPGPHRPRQKGGADAQRQRQQRPSPRCPGIDRQRDRFTGYQTTGRIAL
jgi:hypothetical protein